MPNLFTYKWRKAGTNYGSIANNGNISITVSAGKIFYTCRNRVGTVNLTTQVEYVHDVIIPRANCGQVDPYGEASGTGLSLSIDTDARRVYTGYDCTFVELGGAKLEVLYRAYFEDSAQVPRLNYNIGSYVYGIGSCKDWEDSLILGIHTGGELTVKIYDQTMSVLKSTLCAQGTGQGQIRQPRGIHVTADYIFICDSIQGLVHIFNRSTKAFVRSITGLVTPYDVTTTKASNLIAVAEYTLNRISLWKISDGSYFSSFGTGTGVAGTVNLPVSVQSNSSDIVVGHADENGNNAMSVFEDDTAESHLGDIIGTVHNFGCAIVKGQRN